MQTSQSEIAPELLGLISQIKLIVFDFDGVFTDNTVIVSEDGKESVRCWRGDGLGIKRLSELQLPAFVLSTEANQVVAKRCEKLKLRCFTNCQDKVLVLKQETANMNLSLSQVSYVGNDINDKDCLEVVGLPIVVKDAHSDVLSLGRYQTERPGGYGAVREVCDLFFKAHQIKAL